MPAVEGVTLRPRLELLSTAAVQRDFNSAPAAIAQAVMLALSHTPLFYSADANGASSTISSDVIVLNDATRKAVRDAVHDAILKVITSRECDTAVGPFPVERLASEAKAADAHVLARAEDAEMRAVQCDDAREATRELRLAALLGAAEARAELRAEAHCAAVVAAFTRAENATRHDYALLVAAHGELLLHTRLSARALEEWMDREERAPV